LTQADILGVILAGGQSRRFGENKALAKLCGRRLIDHVAARATPQVTQLAISGGDYGINLPVIADGEAGQGPLGGILSALYWAQKRGFPAIATFPCDVPFFPPDLVGRLRAGLADGHGCSYACSGGVRHPAFGVWRSSATADLQRLFDGGTRSLKEAASRLNGISLDFSSGDGPGGDPFFNINRPQDLSAAEGWLKARGD